MPCLLVDYVSYVVELDVKEYFSTYTSLLDIRNCYIKAATLFEKNMKRLQDPRGDGGDSGQGSNMMSMF